MKKETLAKAKEIEQLIDKYQKISYITTFPYTKFKLFKRRPYISSAGYSYKMEIDLSDPELTKLIETYCQDKIKKLQAEFEEM